MESEGQKFGPDILEMLGQLADASEEEQQALRSILAEILQFYRPALFYEMQLLPLQAMRKPPTQNPGAYFFDVLSALKALLFFPKFLRHTKGDAAGRPFVLAPWQIDIVWDVYGWFRKEDQRRRYRAVWVEVPRKNGKSDFGAGIALYEQIALGAKGDEFYNIASEEKQAKILWKRAYDMIEENPALKKYCYLVDTGIAIPHLKSVFRYLTGSDKGKHGLHPTGMTVDEVHEIPNDKVYMSVHQGAAASPNYIEFLFTTAGERQGFGFEWHEKCRKMIEGIIGRPDELYISIYSADPDDDIADPAVWAKANPMYGLSVGERYIREEYEKTIGNPRLETYFRRYHLNIWTESTIRWLDIRRWDAGSAYKKGEAGWKELERLLAGRRCYGGLDLASRADISALCWVFPPERGDYDGRWYVLCRFWLPEDAVRRRIENDAVPYDRFIRSGALKVTRGNITNYFAIIRQIKHDLTCFDVQQLGIDRWNSSHMVTNLREELGWDAEDENDMLIGYGQGFGSMSSPSKTLEGLVLNGQLEHGNNPVLRWMAQNVRVIVDHAYNMKPTKSGSQEKIDGIVATIMGVGLAEGPEPKDERAVLPEDWDITAI